jgi:hypothetical protein
MASKKDDRNQFARFREAAKKAGGADAKAFERAFKKIVTPKKSDQRDKKS